MHRELELGAGNTIQFELGVAANQGALKRAGHEALPWWQKRSYSQTRGRTAVSQSKGRSMSPSKAKRPTLRRRPVKDSAAQVELALKAAEMVAKAPQRLLRAIPNEGFHPGNCQQGDGGKDRREPRGTAAAQ